MRPTKNSKFCPQCGKSKMVFETKKEAYRFLKYNADEIEAESRKRPVRAYYCSACGGWHVTSKPQSSDRYDLVRKYGSNKGEAIYEKVRSIRGRGVNLREGLHRKLKQLKQALKFQTIDTERCRVLIDDLMGNFETVIRIQLEEPTTINRLFEKFSKLCGIYIYKRELQRQIA